MNVKFWIGVLVDAVVCTVVLAGILLLFFSAGIAQGQEHEWKDISLDLEPEAWISPVPTGLPLDCQMTTPLGYSEVWVKVYYDHEDPDHKGIRYIFTTRPERWNEGTPLWVGYQGVPVAVLWYIHIFADSDYAPAPGDAIYLQLCGMIPSEEFPLIFNDGFDNGNTDRWSKVVP